MSVAAHDAALRMMWLGSPALPIGAYAYSRGLEQAIASGSVADAAAAEAWIEALLMRQLACLDGPLLVRFCAAFAARDHTAVEHWCCELRAFRETSELALEDEQLGMALARLLRGLDELDELPKLATQSYVAMLAYASVRFGLALEDALRVLFFACAESQVTVASKSLPLGQTDAQRVLSKLLAVIPRAIRRAQDVADHELGAYLPGVAMASALHEHQYSRLYRS
jgi:urease accessory protein